MVKCDKAYLNVFPREGISLYKRHRQKDFHLAQEFEMYQKQLENIPLNSYSQDSLSMIAAGISFSSIKYQLVVLKYNYSQLHAKTYSSLRMKMLQRPIRSSWEDGPVSLMPSTKNIMSFFRTNSNLPSPEEVMVMIWSRC